MSENWEKEITEKFKLGQEVVIGGRTATIIEHSALGKWYTRRLNEDGLFDKFVYVEWFSSRLGRGLVNIKEIGY